MPIDTLKRTARLPETRLYPDELETIKTKAREAGLSVSEFQRQACLNTAIIVRESIADFKLIHEINRVGVNLNQIAHAANIGRTLQTKLEHSLNQINHLLDALTHDSENC